MFVEICANRLVSFDVIESFEQGIDDRVSRHMDDAWVDPLAKKVLTRELRRREVKIGEGAGQNAVDLLRPRRHLVPGAKTCLDIRDRHRRIKRGECSGEG